MNDNYLILDGDKIELARKRPNMNKSVDCIIIAKKPIKNNEYDVFLCELSSGRTKEIKDIREKFLNSGTEICNAFNKFDLKFHKFRCILLADKFKNNDRLNKDLNKHIRIPSLYVNGVQANDTIINRFKCNSKNINEL